MTELDTDSEKTKQAAKRILASVDEPGLATANQMFQDAVKEIAEIAIKNELVKAHYGKG